MIDVNLKAPVHGGLSDARATPVHRGPHAGVADPVSAAIEGEKFAKVILADVERGVALPDALEYSIAAVQAAHGRAGLKGLARLIQKTIERRTA